MSKLSRTFHKVGFTLKKHSPEILAVTGAVGVVISGVMACKATLKLDEVLTTAKNSVNDIHADVEAEIITEEESKKELAATYMATGYKVAKLYAPSVILGSLSIGAMLTSNNILRKRNIGLAAAYAAVDKSLKEYRGRIVDRFGEEFDREIFYNLKTKEVEEKIVNEDGSEQTITKTVTVMDNPNAIGDFSRIFAEGNDNWTKNPELNMMYLKRVQAWADEKLRAQGHLFLNEVLDELGYDRTPAGNVVGWIYKKDPEEAVGDNYVDFGLYDIHRQATINFVNGWEPNVLLNFNVDGNILNLI